jgi:pyruvate formate lyase activating enzyme
MKEAMFYEKLKDKKVHCLLCPQNCVILDKKRGNCRVRENRNGTLYSLVYAKPCSIAIDPIEKKPLFHFMPGSSVYSIGTTGCNLHCLFCQNWTTSQVGPEEVPAPEMMPEKIVEEAIDSGCKSIAYTYNEPTIFYEMCYDVSRIAREKGLKNIMVTNGYINEEPAKKLYKYIDAANIDLKGFSEDFYRKITGARLEPVLKTIKLVHEMGVWVELTNLIIPTLNDDMKMVEKMCNWIKDNVGTEAPLHFSRFFPMYKLEHLPVTSPGTLFEAAKVAKKIGLKYVYIGNIINEEGENTYCPKCNNLLVKRQVFEVLENNISKGKCKKCKQDIAGIWE